MDGDPAAALGAHLLSNNQSLAVAESCTGGLIGHLCTMVPGSSDWFAGGIICYSNEVKVRELGVSEDVLAAEGAVSEPVARQLAQSTRDRFGGDWAIAVSGIAGPGGGTAKKPVGLVYIGVAGPDGVRVERCEFDGDRLSIKQQTAERAFAMILEAV